MRRTWHAALAALAAVGVVAAIVVPAQAVREQSGGTHVWVIANDVLEQRPVTVGSMDRSRGTAGIVSGLQPGEQVLIAPGNARAGTQVRISGVPAASPAEAEPEAQR